MATFVDISTEEEQLLTVVQHVTNLKKKKEADGDASGSTQFNNECTRLVQESRTREVILKLINEHEAIFSDQNDKEIEAAMSVVSALIRKLDSDSANLVGLKLREAVASNTSDRPLLRLKILTNIYHAFSQVTTTFARYNTFVLIAKYAHESNNAELMIPKFSIKQMDKLLNDWGVDLEQTRRFYLLIRQILKDNNRRVQAHNVLVKYLNTFGAHLPITPEESDNVRVFAEEAVKEAIMFDEMFQCEHLLSLDPIIKLSKDSQYNKLYRLLQIFAQEKYDAFLEFTKQNPGFMEQSGMDYAACAHKIRLLSLASLGSEHRELDYSTIASTLQIPMEDVENWLIQAVGAKLIEVKMNQLKQTATVIFSEKRQFTHHAWSDLQSQLLKWQSSVQTLLNVVTQVQQQQQPPAQQVQQ